MAHHLLHGTLYATILEADHVTSPTFPVAGAGAGAPMVSGKVSSLYAQRSNLFHR